MTFLIYIARHGSVYKWIIQIKSCTTTLSNTISFLPLSHGSKDATGCFNCIQCELGLKLVCLQVHISPATTGAIGKRHCWGSQGWMMLRDFRRFLPREAVRPSQQCWLTTTKHRWYGGGGVIVVEVLWRWGDSNYCTSQACSSYQYCSMQPSVCFDLWGLCKIAWHPT